MFIKELERFNELVRKFYDNKEFLELMNLTQIKYNQAVSLFEKSQIPFERDMLLFLMARMEELELEHKGVSL